MNRQIKFRGKDKDGNTVFGDLIHGVGHKEGFLYILPCRENLAYIPNCDPLDGVRVEPSTVGQFTGMCDRNGKEIYEGDVVEWQESVADYHQKTFKQQVFMHNAEYTPLNNIFHIGYMDEEMELQKLDCVIIGNIQDNPNILENE